MMEGRGAEWSRSSDGSGESARAGSFNDEG